MNQIRPLILPVLTVTALLIGMTAPPAIRENSWRRFFIAFMLSALGILVPLFVFVTSAALVPNWKGGCDLGWLNCFHLGKLALLPLVVWALGAFYAVEVYRIRDRLRGWIVLGYVNGAIVSTICLLFGLFTLWTHDPKSRVFFIVLIYVAVWFVIRSVHLAWSAKTNPLWYLLAFLGSLPFWIASLIWSNRHYQSLPNTPPDCFVATAAARGHRSWVGPFEWVRHHDRMREANRQLSVLWRFEGLWGSRASASHRRFRRLYNGIGPHLARRITTPLAADLAYIAIKPVELVARLILRLSGSRG